MAVDPIIANFLRIIEEQANAPQTPFPTVDWDAYYGKAREQTQGDFERHELSDLKKHHVGRGIAPNSGLATKGRLEARDRVLTPRLEALDTAKLGAQNNYTMQKAQFDQSNYVNRLNAMLQAYALKKALSDQEKAEQEARRQEALSQSGFSAPPGVAIGSIVGGSPQPSSGPATFSGADGPGPNTQIQTGGGGGGPMAQMAAAAGRSYAPGDTFSTARIPFGGGWVPTASGYGGGYGGSPIGY